MQECSKPDFLDGFCIVSKGIWYLRRDLEKFIDPTEVTSYVTELNPTATNRIQVHHAEGDTEWSQMASGSGEEALSDKFIRSKWDLLPYRRPCPSCPADDNMKCLADCTIASVKTAKFTIYRDCKECTKKHRKGSDARARAKSTDTLRTCTRCDVPSAITSFKGGGNICHTCKNEADSAHATKKVLENSTLQKCTGCPRALLKELFEGFSTCPKCRQKGVRLTACR
jgi:hypothetical protein